MTKAVAGAFAILTVPVVALFGLAVMVTGATAGTGAAGHAVFNPSEEALGDIPPGLIVLYTDAASACPGLPWQVLAGVAKVESDHGRFGGATTDAAGTVRPPIIGIPLNGTNGTAAIPDTDGGRLDRDTTWDRAVGPFQFIPSSWAIYGRDRDGNGVADPHNFIDAAAAAVAHLCPAGSVTDIEAALFSYNRSTQYVDDVLAWARLYLGPLAYAGIVTGGYALPLPGEFSTTELLSRPHHHYPAWDAATPVGTPVFAITASTVTVALGDAGIYTPGGPGRCGNTIVLAGADGAAYIYCHLSAVLAVPGQAVAAGQLIGTTGGTPGTPGAGNTTGPHLHFGIRLLGRSVCPQPLLLSVLFSRPISPDVLPDSGCIGGRPTTDWVTWLTGLPQ